MSKYLGFTGRASEMTVCQSQALLTTLAGYNPAEWVCLHNNGEGADQVFAKVAAELGFTVEMTPDDLRPMPRNRHLVAQVDALVAVTPTIEPVKKGSGTWETVKYARKAGKPVTILAPNDELDFESYTPSLVPDARIRAVVTQGTLPKLPWDDD